jgi:hypothetical protein
MKNQIIKYVFSHFFVVRCHYFYGAPGEHTIHVFWTWSEIKDSALFASVFFSFGFGDNPLLGVTKAGPSGVGYLLDDLTDRWAVSSVLSFEPGTAPWEAGTACHAVA